MENCFQPCCRINACAAKINPATTEIVEDVRIDAGRGATLRPGVAARNDANEGEPDLILTVNVPKAGRYVMRTDAVTDAEGAKRMKEAVTKFESLYLKIQIGDRRPTRRVVYVPWDIRLQVSGKFDFDGGEQELKLWLPRGVRLAWVELAPYVPPAIPAAARNYTPPVTPPADHPRILVNAESLPAIRAKLTQAENQPVWEKTKKTARTPFEFTFDPEAELSFNTPLEDAAEVKAFYFLMTGDEAVGREAVRLMLDYLPRVEFGNLLDITREIGRAIFVAAEVLDWCHPLIDASAKAVFRRQLMRLADDMECGWPPFEQDVVNGHGNEAQVCRDLLSMGIALYDEDPEPYRCCAYLLLEQLVPLRRFEYQSPRHNQGVNYAAYRFGWEMHAAWLFRRMTGREMFDANIKGVRNYWLYLRRPDGDMLRDGDGFSSGFDDGRRPYYWSCPTTTLLTYAYAEDPVVKGELIRQGGAAGCNPVLFLLFNDPAIPAEMSLDALPLSIDFSPVLGGVIARTGWNFGDDADDVIVECKGGGCHFGNHQHADAGAFQIYYRGMLAGDIGVYKFYGTPYDYNFAKRSIAHSMMLAVDPEEKFLNTPANDGGTRFIQVHPVTKEEVLTDPLFHNGNVVFADFGPDRMKPEFTCFAADLVGAYSAKITRYVRNFCFLRLDRADVPAAVIVADDMTTADPAFKKYWQINTLHAPEATATGAILSSSLGGRVGKAHVEMLVPPPEARTMEIRSGKAVYDVFGFACEPPAVDAAETAGSRILFAPKQANARDRFLTVIQLADGDAVPLPVTSFETEERFVVLLADRAVSLSKSAAPIERPFTLDLPAGTFKILLTGLAAGRWQVAHDGATRTFDVEAGRNTICFTGSGGVRRIAKV
jgi:heparin/heparan-sulfate lyase